MFMPPVGIRLALLGFVLAASATAPLAAQETKPEHDVVVARVGAQEILLSEIVARVVALPPQQQQQASFDELYERILGEMIDQTLLTDAAIKAGVDESERYAERMRLIAEQVLRDQYLTDRLRERMTEDKVRARYDEIAAQAEPQVEVRARHILVESEAEAAAIAGEIAAGGDFAALASEHSIDPGSASRGGDLGFFGRGQMVEPFAEAAFSLEPGAVSGPVETQFGWHLVKVEERRAREFPAFEQVREQLAEDMARRQMETILSELRESTEIERFARDGSPIESPAAEPAPAD